METKLVVFQDKGIRKTLHNGEWWFSVVDVCGALTDSPDAGAYWRKLKQRLKSEGSEVVTNCHGLKLEAADGKRYLTDCANTKNMFRIIQTIPSPKAEPFKRWLAKVGYERVQEIESPPAPLFQSGVTIGQRLSVGLFAVFSPFDKGGLRGISETCSNTISI